MNKHKNFLCHDRRTLCIVACLIAVLMTGSGCIPYLRFLQAQRGSCRTPETLTPRDLIGTWDADYSGHYVSDPLTGTVVITGYTASLIRANMPSLELKSCSVGQSTSARELWQSCYELHSAPYSMSGQEQITFFEDGTYRQSADINGYVYNGAPQTWMIDNKGLDGPKTVLNGLRYFGAGLGVEQSGHGLILGPQQAERWLIQEHDLANSARYWVAYPDVGYLFLYPRVCFGELVLQQMTSEGQDPDDNSIQNPLFHRR